MAQTKELTFRDQLAEISDPKKVFGMLEKFADGTSKKTYALDDIDAIRTRLFKLLYDGSTSNNPYRFEVLDTSGETSRSEMKKRFEKLFHKAESRVYFNMAEPARSDLAILERYIDPDHPHAQLPKNTTVSDIEKRIEETLETVGTDKTRYSFLAHDVPFDAISDAREKPNSKMREHVKTVVKQAKEKEGQDPTAKRESQDTSRFKTLFNLMGKTNSAGNREQYLTSTKKLFLQKAATSIRDGIEAKGEERRGERAESFQNARTDLERVFGDLPSGLNLRTVATWQQIGEALSEAGFEPSEKRAKSSGAVHHVELHSPRGGTGVA